MSNGPDKSPWPPTGDSEPADDGASSDAREALDKLMAEGRKLVIEMRRLLREQRKQRQH